MSPSKTGEGGIQPVSYESESLTYFTNLEATGLTLSNARKYTLNRAIKRWKTAGLHTKVDFGIACGNAAAFAVTAFGLVTCTMVGAPTYSNFAVSTASNLNHYELNEQFKDIDPTSHSMGFIATAGSAASANSDMGVLEPSIRYSINSKITTTNVFMGASFTAPVAMGGSTLAAGSGFNAISRPPGSNTFYSYVQGIMRASNTTAPGSTSSTNKVRILMLGGGSTVSSRTMASWFFGSGLTHDEVVQVYAILKSVDNVLRYGEPEIQDSGFGDPIVEADVVVYGLDVAGIVAAYEATRQGLTAVLIGGPRDTSHEHIGYNPIGWVDARDPTTIGGISRAIITAANAQLGVSDTTSQQACSIHQMRWNRISRQMLDPTRVGGTLPGADIKAYLDLGISSVTMTTTAIGRECTEIVSNCGRIFRPIGSRMILVGADYNGDMHPKLGISYTQGTEAAGTAPGEDLNGYAPTALFPLRDSNGASYNSISPYVEEGNAASGLLPTIIELPSIAAGDPDPILQPMNYRFCLTSTPTRMAPMTGGATLAQPANYNAQDFEPLGRLFAAYTANSYTAQMSDCYSLGDTIEGASSAVIDSNNGASGMSTDLAQSGLTFLNAANDAAREAAILRLAQYSQAMAYWILASGDPRIPAALITELQGWGLDTNWGVDPYPGNPLFFPPHPYYREPVYQMRNTFNFNGHDTFAADGTTPRSTKTIACGSYRADRHTTRLVNSGGNIRRQGGINDDEAGGVNNRIPVPLEAAVPDKAECANYICVTAPAWTKIAGASCRMAPVFQGLGQSAGIIAAHALDQVVAVQDINYATFRTALLAVPDAVTPVVPQLN